VFAYAVRRLGERLAATSSRLDAGEAAPLITPRATPITTSSATSTVAQCRAIGQRIEQRQGALRDRRRLGRCKALQRALRSQCRVAHGLKPKPMGSKAKTPRGK
jgi:hypothetical protein